MLIERIRTDLMDARRASDRVRAGFLSALYSEAGRIGKDAGNRASTDDEVVGVVRKFLKNAEETLAAAQGKRDTSATEAEIAALNAYMPQQLSDEEIQKAVEAVIAELGIEKSPKSMGAVMKALRDTYGARLDMKKASTIVNQALKA